MLKVKFQSWAWWCMPITAFKRQRLEDHEFKASLDYRLRLMSKRKD
jgi:hypothetical protein